MDINKMFPSKYLKGEDLRNAVSVTIAGVRAEETYRPGEGKSQIFVLYVEKGSKGVILSRPLAQGIAKILNEPDTDKWVGMKIILYGERMSVAGQERIAIRARSAAVEAPIE
jgi:hypothetical protein